MISEYFWLECIQIMASREVVLDTETTGLESSQGHRIIEIGCVEIVNRRLTGNRFHQYIQPEREIDEGALNVHGITTEFLEDKPRFAEVVDEFTAFIKGAELVIHNAPFDVGFIDAEFGLLNKNFTPVSKICEVTDTLALARKLHPGQKNNLDALCKRYDINNAHRELHGALLDAEILAEVYLIMTGGQSSLLLDANLSDVGNFHNEMKRLPRDRPRLSVIRADDKELTLHDELLKKINSSPDQASLWSTQ